LEAQLPEQPLPYNTMEDANNAGQADKAVSFACRAVSVRGAVHAISPSAHAHRLLNRPHTPSASLTPMASGKIALSTRVARACVGVHVLRPCRPP